MRVGLPRDGREPGGPKMFNFSSVFTAGGLANLGQIIVGDLTMAGDNVVIMGSLASGLPEKDRRRHGQAGADHRR